MYHLLFNKITDTIEELKEVQQLTEEIFISEDNSSEEDVKAVL